MNESEAPSDHGSGPDVELGSDGRFTPTSLAAIAAWARAGHPMSMANYGLAFYQRGERALAEDWSLRAWRAGNVAAGFNLGSMYVERGETNLADQIWQRSAALGDPDAMVGLVRLALERGDSNTVATWSARILDQPQTFPITALGVALRQHGDDEGALRVFDQTIKQGDPFAMEYAARIHDRRGDRREAAQLREQAAEVRRTPPGEAPHR